MAFLSKCLDQLSDANGDPLNGGFLRVYDATTTTFSDVFTDTTLTTPLDNPVECDANGILPAIFLADGNYDLAVLDSEGGVVTGQTWDKVPSVGSDGSSLEKDFTNSRFKVSGSGGEVRVEAGDASPDNVGGTMRIGGWANTQGDALELDFAAINSTGIVTENGKSLSSVVQTEATTFTAVTSVDIPLTESPAGCLGWRVTITRLIYTGAGNLTGRFSYDGGGTYKSGANDYAWGLVYRDAAGSAAVAGDDLDTLMRLGVVGGSTTLWSTIILDIDTVESGNGPTIITGQGAIFDTDATPAIAPFSIAAAGMGDYGRATHLRLLIGGGTNITGRYTVETKRGLGA